MIKEKNIEFLINSIREKLHGADVPKFCWMIGAGCSVRSGIPTGQQVVELLKMEIFKRESISEVVLFNVLPSFDYSSYEREFNAYLQEKKLVNVYEKFIENHALKIKEEVLLFSENNVSNLIPINLRSKNNDPLVLKKENRKVYENLLNEISKDYEYGYYFNQYSESARERQILVEKVIEGKPTKYGYVCLANLIYNNYAKTVFTTNFDDLLNEALMAYFFKHAKVLAHSELSSFIDYRGSVPHIIKVHGDYLFSNIKNTVDEINVLSNHLTEKLCEALKDGFGLVVLGYNGADYSIINKLEETKEKCGGNPFPIIWCDRKNPEDLHWRVRYLLKNTANSFYVKIEGFDALMAKLEITLGLEKVNLEERARDMQKDLQEFYNEVLQEPEIKGEVKAKLEKRRDFYGIFNEAFVEKDVEKSIKLYQEAIELNPDSVESYNNWGWRLIQYGKLNGDKYVWEGIEKLKRALEMNPNYFLSIINWGTALLEIGKKNKDEPLIKEAIEKYEKVLNHDPLSSAAYMNLGCALEQLWKLRREENFLYQAIGKFKKSIEIKSDPLGYNNWGLCLFDLGRTKRDKALLLESLDVFGKAIEINSKHESSYKGWGLSLLELWHITKEKKYLIEALEKFKNGGSDSLYNVSCTYALLGEQNNFFNYFEKALQKSVEPNRNYILEDRDFVDFRNHPEFIKLMNKYRAMSGVVK